MTTLTRDAPEPLYEQLADLVAAQIASGVYGPGYRIPSVRRLHEQHGVSLTTAVEACRLLESRGLVASRPRSGFYVERAPRIARSQPPASPLSLQQRRVDASLSVKLNLGIGNPQQPTLGAAVQGPELMAIPALNRLMSQALRLQPTACHSYDAPPGSPILRRAIAQRGVDAGYVVSPDEVVITSGAKEAVYLSIRAVTRPGDTVAIESPAYYALLEVLASLELQVVEVPSDPRTGIDLLALDEVLTTHPIAAVALVSNYSNPTGSCMTDQDKQTLVALLERHDVPLVEDDVYGDLAFHGPRPKAIKAFDTDGRVLYCGSFSKTASPGLRLGWSLPGRYQNELEHLKLVVNQATATAPQLAVAGFVESGGFDRHLNRVRRLYARQMDQMIEAVDSVLPDHSRHTTPSGGHVLWVQVPGLDAMALYETAGSHGIHLAPGPMFSAGMGYLDHFRLNTGFPFTDRTQAQIDTLGQLIREQIA
ncbi:MAG: PLP-dependent aminotransferase family protein [Aquihabitans sp.]